MEPSTGIKRLSCPVTTAPGMRNVKVPTTQYRYVIGPAPCVAWTMEALGIKRTMAIKRASKSRRERVRGRNSFARCSERSGSPIAVCRTVGEYCSPQPVVGCLAAIVAPWLADLLLYYSRYFEKRK